MRHIEGEKYSVAWFKLAELVARGEKERALGVYRLLSHSLEDTALMQQLEADLLWSFDDPQAIHKYQAAALGYVTTNRLEPAAALYEHLLIIDDAPLHYLEQLCLIYESLDVIPKFLDAHLRLLRHLLLHSNYERARESIQLVWKYAESSKQYIPYALQVGEILVQEKSIFLKEYRSEYIQQLVALCLEHAPHGLTQLLGTLQALDLSLYEQLNKTINVK